ALRRACRAAALAAGAAVLAGCAFTGNGLNTAGLDHIVVGRTTLAQASEDLGAQPTDTWQQGDTVLARWAYKGTAATDAFYVRQEVWLRFGPDGTFQRMENSVNVPVLRHPRTAAEADREAARQRAKTAAASPAAVPPAAAEAPVADDGMIVIPGNGEPAAQPASAAAAGPIPVPPPPPLPAGGTAPAAGSASQPLLPEGTRVVPGVTYPLPSKGR
ncbi:hypothetical protein, partial [Castellaniella sp.]|uniref:hypothetical protein n=1 Tax=Castellaniella sp. TaxID=1955812 RepID=UPI003C73A3C8